jgi:hypothetical protein
MTREMIEGLRNFASRNHRASGDRRNHDNNGENNAAVPLGNGVSSAGYVFLG